MNKYLAILLLSICIFSACKKSTPGVQEQALLNLFKQEKRDLEIFQDESYVAYMEHQVSHFKKKQKKITRLINQINDNFKKLPPQDLEKYISHWQSQFQPIVDEIYDLTKKLIVKETADLTPDKMAKIQELTIRMHELEKTSPDAKLLPFFYKTPVVDSIDENAPIEPKTEEHEPEAKDNKETVSHPDH